MAKESASADTAVANTPASVAFQMEQGAAVRVSSNSAENGIRYQVTMPATEYAALEANTAYQSVSYGILIAPNTYHTENALNEENVFGETPKYDWAIKNQDGEWVYSGQNGKNDSPKRIMNFETDVLSTWSKDTSKKTYFASITDINEVNLPRDFVGVAYIKYTLVDGTTDYVFVQENDNVRSMSQVARAAFNDAESELTSTQKTDLKKAYIDDVYGSWSNFDTSTSLYQVKNSLEKPSLEDDAQCKDGKGVKASFQNSKTGSLYDLKIDVGGEYQFKDIATITIRYKITQATKESNSWWRLFLNDNTTEGQQVVKGTGVTFSDETGRGGGNMDKFATMTITPATANTKTGLTEEDYFTSISFGYRQSAENFAAHGATIIIDSISITFADTEYKAEYLNFNDDKSLAVATPNSNAMLVDIGNGNRALQFELCKYIDSSNPRKSIAIGLGGEYTVSQIESIEISWKVVGVTKESAEYWTIKLNTDAYVSQSETYDYRVTGIGATTFQTTAEFQTSTITQEKLKSNAVNKTLLQDADKVNNLFFFVQGAEGTATIQIDYIKINLKA